MDPNENLKRQLELAAAMLRHLDYNQPTDDPEMEGYDVEELLTFLLRIRDEASELAELVLTLNEWLSKGGFRPQLWADKPARQL